MYPRHPRQADTSSSQSRRTPEVQLRADKLAGYERIISSSFCIQGTAATVLDPVYVAEVPGGLPHLRSAIPDPAQEGEESAAYAGMRKSERQVYRVLSNVHYEHLDALLRSLDFCIGRGFTHPTILRTAARGPVVSALGAARRRALARRSFEVDALDLAKRSDPVPEFVARKDTLAIAVEVYAPLKWEGLDELMDELSSGIKNLDLPLDYRFEARVEQLEQFDSATASSSSSQRARARPRRPDARANHCAPARQGRTPPSRGGTRCPRRTRRAP